MEYTEEYRKLQEENQKLREELRLERSRFQNIADYFNCGMWEYDLLTQTMELSHRFDNIGKLKWNTIRDFPVWVKKNAVVHPEDIGVFERFLHSMESGKESFEYDIRMMLWSMEDFSWIRLAGNCILDENGVCVKAVGKIMDVTEEKKERASLQKRAMQDPLTNLYNKAATKNLIMDRITGPESESEKWAYLIIDLDNFKGINDRYGHLCGDRMLTGFANVLKRCFRKGDIIGRIGGDEFLVFCHNVESEEEVSAIAQKIIDRTYDLDMGDGKTLTVSIGISLFPRDARSYNALYKSADLALYQAKWSGKNRYCIYQKNNNYSIEKREEERKVRDELDPQIRMTYPTKLERDFFDFSFEVLNSTENFFEAFSKIFEKVGQSLYLDGALLIHYQYGKRKAKTIAEWKSKTGSENKDPYEELSEIYSRYWDMIESRFEENESYVYQKDETGSQDFYQEEFFKKDTAKSAIQFPIYDGTQLIGLVTFVDNKMKRYWSQVEYSLLSSLSKMIQSYLIRMQYNMEEEERRFYNSYIEEEQRLVFYAIDKETYEIGYVNRFMEEVCPEAKPGKKCYEVIGGRGKPCSNCPIMDMTEDDRKKYFSEVYCEDRDVWYSVSVTELEWRKKKQYLLCWNNITNFLEHINAKDRLTGLYSYDKFQMEAIKRIADPTRSYAVLSIGVKDFSSLNENYGYEAGDEFLRGMADRFADSLMEDELAGRVKGDDFLLLLRSEESEELISRVSRILNSVKSILEERHSDISCKCNCGIYYIKKEDHSVSRILDRANKARKVAMNLYSGEHSFFVYSREFEEQMIEERRMEKGMLKALRRKEFQIYLQPKVNLRSGEICGAEALVRWVRKNGDVLLPEKFIPLFERNRFVLQIDDYVYRNLFLQMKEWLSQNKELPIISVNVSRIHLLMDNFPEHFCEMVDLYEIPHHLIEVEVTESAFVENTQVLVEMTTRLREMGFLISMDDFGTGYSSLNFVKMLPIDVLKIDGNFFRNNNLDEKSKAVISSVLQLGRSMDLKIVTEGIETEEQADYVLGEECDIAQGYFYYKPMTMNEFGKLLKTKSV